MTAPAEAGASVRRRWRAQPLPLVAAGLAMAGMLVLLYPAVAAWFSQYDQSRLVDVYTARVAEGLDPTATERLALARAYNDALLSGAALAAGERVPTGEGTSEDETLDYWSMLRAEPLEVMARLRIPTIDVDLPVYHGTSDTTLERGVGHLQGTSLPIGGAGTHAVLTAHRGLASATMFTNLDRVAVGDAVTIEVLGEVLRYEVRSTTVVAPDRTESLRPIRGRDLLTLVTCTPLGINTDRILVTAERVLPTPVSDLDSAGTSPNIPGFPWWAIALGAGTLIVAGYVWHAGIPRAGRVGHRPGGRG